MVKTASEKHFDKIAAGYDSGKKRHSYYYESLKDLLGSLIPRDKKVFEIGCGTGNLLVSLKPRIGYGMDISSEMIKIAKVKYLNNPQISFSTEWPKGRFGYVFMSDVIEHLENPQEIFHKVLQLMDKKSIFIITMANPILEPILLVAERLGLKMKEGPHIRLSTNNLKLIINNSKLEIIKHDYKLLMPIYIPFVTVFINKYLEKYFKRLAFIEYFVVVRA